MELLALLASDYNDVKDAAGQLPYTGLELADVILYGGVLAVIIASVYAMVMASRER